MKRLFYGPPPLPSGNSTGIDFEGSPRRKNVSTIISALFNPYISYN
jgi:hypothetical protein